MTLWMCPECDVDNAPEHCCEPPNCEEVCTCGCWECNPQTCIECSAPLHETKSPLGPGESGTP